MGGQVERGDELASIPSLPSAHTHWDELNGELAGADPVVFLDYDGTLTPIVAHPDVAVLGDGMRSALEHLAGQLPVAIVSGRDVQDVMDKVGVPGLWYAGSHGFDIRTPSGAPAGGEELERFADYLPALAAVEAELGTALADIPGAYVERKRFAIAVHYRQVEPERHAAVTAVVEHVASRHPTLRVTGGKMIREFRPDVEWDKGRAVRWLVRAMGLDHERVAPLYVGDDETDEDAFAVVRSGGVGIVVGDEARPSLARYRLSHPDEVEWLLRELAVSRAS